MKNLFLASLTRIFCTKEKIAHKMKNSVEEKAKMRRLITGKLKSLSEQEKKEQSKKIYDKLVNSDVFKNSKHVFLYVSVPSLNEVDTHELIKHLFQKEEKCVYVPYCEKAKLMQSVHIGSIVSTFFVVFLIYLILIH